MKWYECEYCGASLDPGENCDCQNEKEEKDRKIQDMFSEGEDGQMEMRWEAICNH